MFKHPTQRWTVGEYEFREFNDPHHDRKLYDFLINGERAGVHELYASLDEALVAAVGEKHTGPPGAHGSGVGTAANWFMRMIGAVPTRGSVT